MIKLITKCAFMSCISFFAIASSIQAETPAVPIPVRDETGHRRQEHYDRGSRGRDGDYRSRDYRGQRRYRDRGYNNEGGVYFYGDEEDDDDIDYDDNYFDGNGRFDSY